MSWWDIWEKHNVALLEVWKIPKSFLFFCCTDCCIYLLQSLKTYCLSNDSSVLPWQSEKGLVRDQELHWFLWHRTRNNISGILLRSITFALPTKPWAKGMSSHLHKWMQFTHQVARSFQMLMRCDCIGPVFWAVVSPISKEHLKLKSRR